MLPGMSSGIDDSGKRNVWICRANLRPAAIIEHASVDRR